jgi:hypothetical protein
MDLLNTLVLAGFLLVMLLSGFLIPPYLVNKVLKIKNKIANRTSILLLFAFMGILVTNIMVNAVMLTSGAQAMMVMPWTNCATMRPSCGTACMNETGGWTETSLCGFAQRLEYLFVVIGLGTLIWRDLRRSETKKKHAQPVHTHPAHHHN